MKPLDPRLLEQASAARWFIAGVVALATLGAGSTLVIAWQLTRFITSIFVAGLTPNAVADALVWVALAGLVKGGALWAQEVLAVRAASSARAELRGKYLRAVARLAGRDRGRGHDRDAEREPNEQDSTGARQTLVTRGLDALDAYFAKYLPQLILTALVTPAFAIVIWQTDWLSGVIVLVTVPLIPLFMVVIGLATRSVQQGQLDALTRLSQHFLEVLRGLTTLKVFRRERAQVATLEAVGEQYRKRTMLVLTVSFLSGFALELAASLSVALMAVSIGFRLMNGSMALTAGLFVLLLAPETYLPLRMVGANFHAAAEGVLASGQVLDAIDEAKHLDHAAVGVVVDSASNLTAHEVAELVEPGSLTVLIGASGAGKTTRLERLRADLARDEVAWLPQGHPVFTGTVLENIVGHAAAGASPLVDSARLARAVALAGLDDLHLDAQVGVSGTAISGGQRQRVALARAFYRALGLERAAILLDEPLSAIDPVRSARIIAGLRELVAAGHGIVAISHQDALAAAADRVIEVVR